MNNGKQLWNAVIEQAITDATAPLSTRCDVRMDQLRTREWLTKPSQDFEDVCALAGIEPDRVRATAAQLIEAVSQQGSDRGLLPKRARIPVRGLYHYAGRSLTIGQWAAATGIAYHLLYNRMSRGWSIERALTKPIGAGQRPRGVGQSVFECCPDRSIPTTQETTELEIFQ